MPNIGRVKLKTVVVVLVLVGAPALLLSACTSEDPKFVAPFAVKVNGQEISLSRLRFTQARAEAQQPGRAVDTAGVIDGLIDQTLFAQKAAKLERKGFVPAALQDATATILARAYIESLAGPGIEPAEVARYYEEHVQLFGERRIFRIFELAVLAPPARIAALKARAKRAASLQPIVEWLKAERVSFNVGGATKTSEQLAPRLLDELSHMRDGELRVLKTDGGASVLHLVQSEPAPLSRQAAAPMIEALLRARKQQEAVARESAFLRKQATIEYGVELAAAGAKPAAGE